MFHLKSKLYVTRAFGYITPDRVDNSMLEIVAIHVASIKQREAIVGAVALRAAYTSSRSVTTQLSWPRIFYREATISTLVAPGETETLLSDALPTGRGSPSWI